MAETDHVKVFLRGADAWNRWRRKHRGTQPDLSHADLQGANCRLANLNHANLRFANLEGANLGRAYLEAAELEGAQPRGAHLFGADLGRADLRHADLQDAQLWHARLEGADLRAAKLESADLRFCDLADVNLREADLEGANLDGASLLRADLRHANLRGTRLDGTRLWSVRLEGADLEGAEMCHTAIGNVDLSRTLGLAEVRHAEPSSIGVDTLERTAAGLSRDPRRSEEIETFLRRAGVGESFVELFRARISRPFEHYNALLRYSFADRVFAHKLSDELLRRGLRCWLHEHPMLPGDDVHEELELDRFDRLVLLASEAALTSWWIDSEIAHALAKERRLASKHGGEARVLTVVDLGGTLADGDWQGPEGDRLRSRLSADFTGWADDGAVFVRATDRLARALTIADGSAGEKSSAEP